MSQTSEMTNKWLSDAFAYQGIEPHVDDDCCTMCGSPIDGDPRYLFDRLDEANSIGAMYLAGGLGMVTIKFTLQKTVREPDGRTRVTHVQRLPDTNKMRMCYIINSINDTVYGVTFCRDRDSGELYMEKHVMLVGNPVEDGLRLRESYRNGVMIFLRLMPIVCMAHDKERYSINELDRLVKAEAADKPGLTREYDLFMCPVDAPRNDRISRADLLGLLGCKDEDAPQEPPDTSDDNPDGAPTDDTETK